MISNKQNQISVILVSVLAVVLFCSVDAVFGQDQDRGRDQDRLRIHVEAEPIASNCLSYPVIFAEGGMTFRGTVSIVALGGAYDREWLCDHTDPADHTDECDFTDWYLQQDPLNEWQAVSGNGANPTLVDWIDWGDNLEARPWKTSSIVRVETVLFKEVTTAMTAYEMRWISGNGIDEMWGTNGEPFPETLPTVYASSAKITVQFMGPDNVPEGMDWIEDDEVLGLTRTWVLADGQTPAGEVVMDKDFSAEVNVKGKVIHGCSWNVRTDHGGDDKGAGYYRITMSFSSGKPDLSSAAITGTEVESTEGEEPQGGVAAVDAEHNLTYIDVLIVKATGNGGGGGGSGGGSGGGGSGGGGSGGGGSPGGGNH